MLQCKGWFAPPLSCGCCTKIIYLYLMVSLYLQIWKDALTYDPLFLNPRNTFHIGTLLI
jgi:hypothetical protein